MKVVCFLFVFIAPLFTAQPDAVDKTLTLLKQNNWPEIYKAFAANVDVTILSDNNVASKDDAQTAISNFLTKNQPYTVKLIHKIDSNPDMKMLVVLMTGKTCNYRTSVTIKNNNGNYQISEFTIEPEKTK